jgi:glucokinase
VNLPVLAIDIGGTKLAAGLVATDGAVSLARRLRTPSGEGAEAVFTAVVELAEAVILDAGSPALQGIGVGCGGPMQWPEAVVTPLNLPDWVDFPLRRRLEERHPALPVRVHNDAVCFAIAEHWVGAGSGSANMMGIIVSTGVGGGLILGSRLIDGGTGNAGHIGHVVVDPVGPVCNCGGIGCLQAIAKGPNVVAWAREHGWVAAASAAGPELAASARAGDPVASAALALAGTAVGIAIASAAALLDLDLVVIGGGLADSGEVLLGPVRRAVERHLCVPFGKRVEVLVSGVGAHAGLVGAAALVHRGDAYWSAG